MLDIPKIRAAVDAARRWDFDLSLFGTWGHVHHFLPVLPEEELGAWEEEMGLTLPQDYRDYLTQLGNGGPGPAYGLMPFRLSIRPCLRRRCIYSEDQEAAFQRTVQQFIHWYGESEEDWDLYLRYFPDTPARKRQGDWRETHRKEWQDQLDAVLEREVVEPLTENGQLFIANEGCSGDIYLILNGTHRGYCHCCSTDIDPDLAYPAPGTFAAYRDRSLTETFGDYLMTYVDKIDALCRELPAGKRRQFQWERAGARDFYAAVQAKDWEGAAALLAAIHAPLTLSRKTRTFYAHYEEALNARLPGDGRVTAFYDAMYQYGIWHHDSFSVPFRNAWNAGGLYPRISFEEFVQDLLSEENAQES